MFGDTCCKQAFPLTRGIAEHALSEMRDVDGERDLPELRFSRKRQGRAEGKVQAIPSGVCFSHTFPG